MQWTTDTEALNYKSTLMFSLDFDLKSHVTACKLKELHFDNWFHMLSLAHLSYSHSAVVKSACASHVHTRHACERVFRIVSVCVLGCEPLACSLLRFKSLAAFPASCGICRPESPLSITALSDKTPPHPPSPQTATSPQLIRARRPYWQLIRSWHKTGRSSRAPGGLPGHHLYI